MTAKSEFADVRFRVQEFEGGVPYIGTLENGPTSNTTLNDTTSFLMTLKKGTTTGEAQELVEHLNQVVEQISIQPQR
jgi:acyl-coenzyme A thioesterase PaaI-like protein